jgi:hypothetical protein
MAFQQSEFCGFVKSLLQNTSPEARAVAENFILEERLNEARESSYSESVAVPSDSEDWTDKHDDYIAEKINTYEENAPETFTNINSSNFLKHLEGNQYLVRLENLKSFSRSSRLDVNNLQSYLNDFIKNKDDSEFKDILEEAFSAWNRKRDLRPIFAGFWGEVKELFTDPDENEIENPEWANKLRDIFGLGHYDPFDGENIPVLLLRYRVNDVLNAGSEKMNAVAVPTVLDSSWSPFFCPTPQNGEFHKGQTVNLSPGDESNYTFNCEIIHRFIEYKPEFIYRTGLISRAPGKSCEQARKIHLEFLSDDFKYFSELEK